MNLFPSVWLARLGGLLVLALPVAAKNFSAGSEPAARFGVHEIALPLSPTAGNPFDRVVTVTFTPPSGEANARTVEAFYDGDNRWCARVYAAETGAWRWSTSSPETALDHRGGSFEVQPSSLRGRLLPHPGNPRQWMTEDGRWFLNLSDTAYFLLSPYAGNAEPVTDEDFRDYVRDAVDHGITSVRSFTLMGPGGFLDDSNNFRKRWSQYTFTDESFTLLNLENFRVADERLRWLLEHHPDLYVQFILFSRGAKYGADDQVWLKFTPEQKNRVLRYLVARYAAYPQVFWLVTNDAHYGTKHPNNTAMAREVGEYFQRHDPWRHPLATGPARGHGYLFADESWSTYIHLEEHFAVGAAAYERFHAAGKPVFLGEDRYEQDRPEDRDPRDMRYFQRRLFWAWLFSGGSANYGGRWWVVHPYSQTGRRDAPSPWPVINGGEYHQDTPTFVHRGRLTGLDSVRPIRDFFTTRNIDLSGFLPDHGRVRDPEGATGAGAPRLTQRDGREFLIYHPNATSDGREMKADPTRTPHVAVDLRDTPGVFAVEWYRPHDGTAKSGEDVAGGEWRTLRSPWPGEDCVIRLSAK